MLEINDLEQWSYRTSTEKSLKNTLRKFDEVALEKDLMECILHFYYIEEEIDGVLATLPFETSFRTKSMQSIKLKIKKNKHKDVKSIFNDILGIRLILDYEEALAHFGQDKLRVVDMREGKRIDDGYQGLHFYYQKDNLHFPIEIQVWSPEDALFNNWMHIYTYKIHHAEIGQNLRILYNEGIIHNEETFRKELKHELSSR